jgi:RNA polymerase sigma factor (sigma-70 family)
MESSESSGATGKRPEGDASLARVWDQFYRYCFTIINQCPGVRMLSTSDREDCVQDVMMEIVRKFGEHQPGSSPDHLAGWIRVLSRNKAADIFRRRFRKPEVLFDDGTGAGVLDGNRAEGEPELAQGECVSLVWEALISLDQKVSATSYLVFYLRTIEGWDIPEISELFQISSDQARARCHRVKKKFGSILKTQGKKRGGVS